MELRGLHILVIFKLTFTADTAADTTDGSDVLVTAVVLALVVWARPHHRAFFSLTGVKSRYSLAKSGRMSSSASGARLRSSLMALSAVYVGLFVGKAVAATTYNRPPAFIYATARASPFLHQRSPWTSRSASSCRRRPVLLSTMALDEFNGAEIVNHLEHDYRADLALLATKFGTMVESVDDIEEVHVAEIDG